MQQTHAAIDAELTTTEFLHATAGVNNEASHLGDHDERDGGGAAAPNEVTACLFKRVKHCVAPATPATWSRYIDSRLKQFCTR